MDYRLLMFIVLIFQTSISCESPKKTDNTENLKSESIEKESLFLSQLEIQPDVFVSFLLKRNDDSSLVIINGAEKILLNDFTVKNDAVVYSLHVFDADLVLQFGSEKWEGYWRKNYVEDYTVNFSASPAKVVVEKKKCSEKAVLNDNEYEMTLFNNEKSRKAKLLLEVRGDSIYGTIMTRTGDYRYLNGKVGCSEFDLSTFNGESAYKITGQIHSKDSLSGDFYSGKTRHETWVASTNSNFELEDPTAIGSISGYKDEVNLKAQNLQKEWISLNDDKYKNQPVVIQILGTWCPNCMDEAAFIKQWIQDHPDVNIQFLGIAFEMKDDFEYAKKRIELYKEKYDLSYEILFGGVKSKENVQTFFPFLDGVVAYPTTIFLNKEHQVVKIHTGFSGPASGKYYEAFKKDFNKTIQNITL